MKANRLLNLLTFLGVIAVNALANILPINGKTTGDVSAMYENYFTPAGFTFTIWGLIYTTLLLFVIFQLMNRTSNHGTSLDASLGYWLVINFVANMGWIFAWHYGHFFWTLVLMVVILSTLVMANVRTEGFSSVVRFPLQVYLGWICVATIANVAVYLTYRGWRGWGLEGWQWGIALVIIAGVLAIGLAIWRGYVVAALTIAWGVYGLYGKQMSIPSGVVLYANICLVVIAAVALAAVVKLGREFLRA